MRKYKYILFQSYCPSLDEHILHFVIAGIESMYFWEGKVRIACVYIINTEVLGTGSPFLFLYNTNFFLFQNFEGVKLCPLHSFEGFGFGAGVGFG